MISFPSIANSSKAPRKNCIAFDKLDGSNFRAKYTQKQGFNLYGTRTQLIDKNTEFWGEIVDIFEAKYKEVLEKKFRDEKEYRNQREILAFGEFFGYNSFAGRHEAEPHQLVFFDFLIGHKNRKFVPPLDFIKEFQEIVPIPDVIYIGKLNDEFIMNVRNNEYNLKEGVICKGTEPRGDYVGGIWTCKIKTLDFMKRLQELHKADWEKYWE